MSQDKDAEFLAALENFREPQTVDAAKLDVCGTYNQVRPILSGLLPFLKHIPVIGTRGYNAINSLMQVLDAFCPAPASSSPAP